MDELAKSLPEEVAAVQGWLARELSTPAVLAQGAALLVAGLLALALAARLRRWARSWHRQAGQWQAEQRQAEHRHAEHRQAGQVGPQSPFASAASAFVRRASLVLMPLAWPVAALLLVSLAIVAARAGGWPHELLRLAASLLAAWVAIRLSASLVRDRLWSRLIALGVWTIAALGIFDVLDATLAYLDGLRWRIGDFSLSPVSVLTGAAWLAVLLWFASFAARLIEERVLSQSRATPSLKLLSARLLKVVMFVAAVFIALDTMGIDLTAFAVFTGAIGVGIGFGLQSIFNNFIAGIILLTERSLKVGDFIDLGQDHLAGTVRQINIRNTIITTPDSIDVAVPNSEFVNGRVTNWTMLDVHARIHVPFSVAYATDAELLRKAVCEAAAEVKFTLKGDEQRTPQLWLVRFGESRLEFELVVWLTSEGIHRPLGARAAYCWAIWQSLRRHGIDVPFPQRDLHLKTAPGLSPDLGGGGREGSGGGEAGETANRPTSASPPLPLPFPRASPAPHPEPFPQATGGEPAPAGANR